MEHGHEVVAQPVKRVVGRKAPFRHGHFVGRNIVRSAIQLVERRKVEKELDVHSLVRRPARDCAFDMFAKPT